MVMRTIASTRAETYPIALSFRGDRVRAPRALAPNGTISRDPSMTGLRTRIREWLEARDAAKERAQEEARDEAAGAQAEPQAAQPGTEGSSKPGPGSGEA
jgi:hypothetical protein